MKSRNEIKFALVTEVFAQNWKTCYNEVKSSQSNQVGRGERGLLFALDHWAAYERYCAWAVTVTHHKLMTDVIFSSRTRLSNPLARHLSIFGISLWRLGSSESSSFWGIVKRTACVIGCFTGAQTPGIGKDISCRKGGWKVIEKATPYWRSTLIPLIYSSWPQLKMIFSFW